MTSLGSQTQQKNDAAADVVSLARWRVVCSALGASDCDREHQKLLRTWAGFGRHYHTVDHLTACLREFDRARSLAARPAEVELGLWFHDAIYRTYRSDNEARSAEWAARFLASHGVSSDVVSRVRELILVTAHSAAVLTADAALVADVDLSILGQPTVVYDEFERNVRKEYWWVPKRRYGDARSRILQGFLARAAIYHWPHFRESYEEAARKNLRRAIDALASS